MMPITAALSTSSDPSSRQNQIEGAPFQETAPSRPLVNRILLGATAVCSLLSVIPPLRLGAGLALRSISCLSVFASNLSSPEKGWSAELIKTGKIAATVLGIAGLAVALPAMMIVSLVIDLALQIYECCRNFLQGEHPQALIHLAMILTGIFSLLGMITGTVDLICIALFLNALIMLGYFFAVSKSAGRFDEALCFLALFGASFIGCAVGTGMTTTKSIHKALTFRSDHQNDRVIIKTLDGKVVAEGLPGQHVRIDITRPVYQITNTGVNPYTGNSYARTIVVNMPMKVVPDPLPPALFGAMPVTAPAIHAVTQNIPSKKEFDSLPL